MMNTLLGEAYIAYNKVNSASNTMKENNTLTNI